ncbi:hypothetical protein ABZ863_33620 [Saccharomonospora sp. NPDC046836]|uniref:hypothetical protein n=1 Tax=Saccharomonospora sp. NPDC046836 TaxID=3156921 RepID=UPI0033D4C5FF
MSATPHPPSLVIRPARRVWWQAMAGLPIVTVAIVLPLAAQGEVVVALVALGVFAVVLPALAWSLRRRRVVLGRTEIGRSGVLGRLRTWRRTDVALVVRAVLPPPPRGRFGPVHTVFLLNASGRCLLRLRTPLYTLGDLDRFVELLASPVAGPDQQVTPKELARLHPGIVPWAERRPLAAALVFTATVVFLALLTAILVAESAG